jgi:hypothetical protein
MRRKRILNIAWVEKAHGVVKRLITVLMSANGSKDRDKLLKMQLPVHSRSGEEHLRQNGLCYQGINSRCIGDNSENLIMRWADGLIKVTKTYPKDSDYCQGRTTVSTKGSNTYVEGSSEVADLR